MKILNALFIFILAFVFLLLLGAHLLHRYILPTKFKALAIEKIEEQTARKVEIENVGYSLLKGIVVKDLKIYEADGETEFLKVDRVTFNILILPILKEKRIIIPALDVHSPRVLISKAWSGKWNFQTIPFLARKKPAKNGHRLFLITRRLSIYNGEIAFEDKTRTPAFRKVVKDLNVKVALGMPFNLKYRLACLIGEESPAKLSSQGAFNLVSGEMTTDSSIENLGLQEYAAYYEKALPVKIVGGKINGAAMLSVDKERRLAATFSGPIQDFTLQFKQIQSKADFSLDASMTYILEKPETVDYSGEVALANLSLQGLPYLEDFLQQIQGKLKFDRDGLATDDLKLGTGENFVNVSGTLKNFKDPLIDVSIHSGPEASFKLPEAKAELKKFKGELKVTRDLATLSAGSVEYNGLPLNITGELQDFKDPKFRLSATTTLDLAGLKEALPENLLGKLKDTSLTGISPVALNISGRLKPSWSYDVSGELKLVQASATNPAFPEGITQINGIVKFEKDAAVFPDLSFRYKDTDYSVKCSIAKFATPFVELALSSKLLNMALRCAVHKEDVSISMCRGKYYNSTFDVVGETKGFKNPLLNFRGRAKLDLDDMKRFFPRYSQFLTKTRLRGLLDISMSLKGKLKDWKAWKLDLEAHSSPVSIWGLKFDRVYIDFGMRDKKMRISQITASPYYGHFSAVAIVNLLPEEPTYTLEAELVDANLAEWRKDTKFAKKRISGLFSGKVNLQGSTAGAETITGNGWIRIRDGYLWETPIFARLAALLRFPALQEVAFKQAYGTFTIKDKNVSTTDLTLYSDEMSLLAKGGVGFDTRLGFDLTLNFSEGLARRGWDPGILGSFLLTEAGKYLGEIKLKGSLKEPRYAFKPFPVKKIIEEKLFDRMRKLFEDIVE